MTFPYVIKITVFWIQSFQFLKFLSKEFKTNKIYKIVTFELAGHSNIWWNTTYKYKIIDKFNKKNLSAEAYW